MSLAIKKKLSINIGGKKSSTTVTIQIAAFIKIKIKIRLKCWGMKSKKTVHYVKATNAKKCRNHIKSTDQVMDVITSPVQQYICQLLSKILLLSSPKFIHCYHYHDWAWLFSHRSQFHLLPISPRSIFYDLPSVATVKHFLPSWCISYYSVPVQCLISSIFFTPQKNRR